MNRLKAFTLADMMVAMVISSLVVAFAFSAFLIMGKNFNEFKTENNALEEMHQLQSLLTHDFSLCELARKKENTIGLKMPDGNDIRYEVREGYVLRKRPAGQDTFKLEVTALKGSFGMDSLSPDGSIIDGLKIQAGMFQEKRVLAFSKWYGADVLLNRDSLNKTQEP